MRHATPETIAALDDLSPRCAAIDGITEKRPGAFSRGSRAFLHFHDDPTGYYADVRFGADFERVRVTTRREQQALRRAHPPRARAPSERVGSGRARDGTLAASAVVGRRAVGGHDVHQPRDRDRNDLIAGARREPHVARRRRVRRPSPRTRESAAPAR